MKKHTPENQLKLLQSGRKIVPKTAPSPQNLTNPTGAPQEQRRAATAAKILVSSERFAFRLQQVQLTLLNRGGRRRGGACVVALRHPGVVVAHEHRAPVLLRRVRRAAMERAPIKHHRLPATPRTIRHA